MGNSGTDHDGAGPSNPAAHVGARWWKVDFHAHTPASFDFGGLDDEPAKSEVTYEEWLRAYMAAEIDVVVIADHNTADGITAARQALAAMDPDKTEGYRDLVLIAGVEITVEGGYHLLAVFDRDTAPGVIEDTLANAGIPSSERGTASASTNSSFLDVVKIVANAGGLAVPAHADAERANVLGFDKRTLDKILRSKHIHAIEMKDDGGSYRKQLRDFVPLQGSDAHHLDGSTAADDAEAKYPGSHYTWVKMQLPNQSGLRIAIADGPDSVIRASGDSSAPGEIRHSHIESLSVEHDNTSASYSFGPWLNTVIGGRGAGKSSLVEMMRTTMGVFDDLPAPLAQDLRWFDPNNGVHADRFWDESTEITLGISKRCRTYRASWRGSEPSATTINAWDVESGNWVREEGSAKDRFPVQIYSQKQLFESARQPNHLLTMVDRQSSVNRPEWDRKWSELETAYRKARTEVQALEAKIATSTGLRGELSDLEPQIKSLALRLDSAESRELESLEDQEQELAGEKTMVEAFVADLHAALEDVEGLAPAPASESQDSHEAPTASPEPESDNAVGQADQRPSQESHVETWQIANAEAISAVRTTTEELDAAHDAFAAANESSDRLARIRTLRSQLTVADEPSSKKEGTADHLRELKERKQQVMAKIEEVDLAVEQHASAVTDATSAAQALAEHRAVLTRRRREVIEKIVLDNVSVRLHAQASPTSFENGLRRVLQKTSAFDEAFDALNGLGSVAAKNPRDPKWVAGLTKLRTRLLESAQSASSAEKTNAHGFRMPAKLVKHLQSLDIGALETELHLWFPEDELDVRYRRDSKDAFKSVTVGSPGQRTAAILTIVLAVGEEPMILDQPEDDLDNDVIFTLIVAALRSIKNNRQVIVVTHNPNVVVNADAENVLVLKYGKLPVLSASGSIQIREVRNAVCEIMEGGRTAFEARYKRLLDPAFD
ncbi:TrlF family AAA-like ATPase [Demequina sp. SO4-13]|uniref:TrlF family AAA-like ATPase n=1 Tax=Demequina sp. SO4-13 TaxID=3401027 RepID=UPI003AF50069